MIRLPFGTSRHEVLRVSCVFAAGTAFIYLLGEMLIAYSSIAGVQWDYVWTAVVDFWEWAVGHLSVMNSNSPVEDAVVAVVFSMGDSALVFPILFICLIFQWARLLIYHSKIHSSLSDDTEDCSPEAEPAYRPISKRVGRLFLFVSIAFAWSLFCWILHGIMTADYIRGSLFAELVFFLWERGFDTSSVDGLARTVFFTPLAFASAFVFNSCLIYSDSGKWQRCRRCFYLLKGLAGSRCPECGQEFDLSVLSSFTTRKNNQYRTRLALRIVGGCIIIAVLVTALIPLWKAYVQHRQSKPEYGRWLQEDPMETGARVYLARISDWEPSITGLCFPPRINNDDGINLYQCARNIPTHFDDPFGRQTGGSSGGCYTRK